MHYSSANDSVIYWRDLAATARATAETLTDPAAREHMMNCVKSYERLAQLDEQRIAFAQKRADR
jgi:hypothetical protein